MTLLSRLYVGRVYHKRFKPKVHSLSYGVFSLLLDLSEIDQIAASLWLFSRNRFNLFSFHDKDFGRSSNETLEYYVHRSLNAAGIEQIPARILLSCYPRVLGHAFNPLSLFYCLDDNDNCYAVIHEVHNTFGERHSYVLPAIAAESTDRWIHQDAGKKLFVSPFASMGLHYRFRLNQPDEKQVILIRVNDEQGVLITAGYTARQLPLTASQLLKVFIRFPLLGAKVVGGIHWEALKLWLKGIPLFKHQPKGSV